MKNQFPDLTSDSDQNTSVITPSESQEEILLPNDNFTAVDGGTILEAIVPASSSNFRPEPPSTLLVAVSQSGSVDQQSSIDPEGISGDSDTSSDESDSSCWPPKVRQFRNTQGQLENTFSGHCIS